MDQRPNEKPANSSSKKRSSPTFRRYTNLAAAIHLLLTKRITLLNPATWDDKNDAYFMAEYKRIMGKQNVLALCFTESDETYHHWRVFSHGSDGVCIQFDRDRLLATFKNISGIRTEKVKYKLIRDIKKRDKFDAKELPFLKRRPYEDEKEYRIIYEDGGKLLEFRDVPIEISCIRRLTLSPWMSKTLAESVKKSLRAIAGCSRLKVERSTLIRNEQWKSVTSRACVVES